MRPECASAAARYRLVLPRGALSGRAGDRLGKAAGSSLEFMDFRDYAPGDDLRHVDWRSYARTDQLKVRLYREEVSPSVDVIVDLSKSMAVSETKARALRDLVAAACAWTRRGGGVPRRFAAGGAGFEDEETVTLDATQPVTWMPLAKLRARSLRFLISDFLDPRDPKGEIRRIAMGASHLYVVQLLDPWEAEPERDGPATLIDCELGNTLELVLDARTIAAYRDRLSRLTASLRQAVSGVGGTFARVVADSPVVMFRQHLMSQGIVEAVH